MYDFGKCCRGKRIGNNVNGIFGGISGFWGEIKKKCCRGDLVISGIDTFTAY